MGENSLLRRIRFTNKGEASPIIIGIMILLLVMASVGIGGILPQVDNKYTKPVEGDELDVGSVEKSVHDNLQLKTFGLKKCTGNAALSLLIDNSGSMDFGSKMEDLKNALRVFADNFPDNGAVAMQTYSIAPTERVPFEKLFAQSKPQFLLQTNLMTPLSGTHSKDAFVFAKQKLDAGRPKFPNHKFAMLFISDGIPETAETNRACPGGTSGQYCGRGPTGACRCFSQDQDPTAIAAQIKQSGVRVFTIAYTDTSDQKFDSLLKNMMTNVASSPNDAYVAPVTNKVLEIVKQITNKLCTEV